MTMGKNKTRILVNIPIELKKQAEQVAAGQNRSLSNYIITLIQQDIERETKESVL